MKTLQYFCIMIVCCVVFCSCKTTYILRSTFESDAINALPNKTLPGDPSGDALEYSSQLEPRLKVVSLAGKKSLQFSQSTAPGLTAFNQWITFRGVSTDFTQTVWYYYTATQKSATGGYVLVEVADGSAGIIARLTINANGEVSLLRNLTTQEQEVIGTIPEGVSHTVIFTVNMAASKYNVTILKSAGETITATDRTVVLGKGVAYANPARPTLNFRYENGETNARQYSIDEVTISREKPKM
ncbi:hypothetical protein GCM10028803_07810 [Larkinella knui]|uniref:Uncharacterized protein n=1 Tax=Larkinella knui TaxID=2025310 RepID=A0A3P1CJZ1_9BACT|nr:hypothetical protein [Larkinella knui]RRB13548.1 hypothetical protein EHT87_14895 [Larkinella knui]